jgi:hypothetical protein
MIILWQIGEAKERGYFVADPDGQMQACFSTAPEALRWMLAQIMPTSEMAAAVQAADLTDVPATGARAMAERLQPKRGGLMGVLNGGRT